MPIGIILLINPVQRTPDEVTVVTPASFALLYVREQVPGGLIQSVLSYHFVAKQETAS